MSNCPASVSVGETVDSIAAGYGVAPKQLAADNELPPDYALAVGQTLVGSFGPMITAP